MRDSAINLNSSQLYITNGLVLNCSQLVIKTGFGDHRFVEFRLPISPSTFLCPGSHPVISGRTATDLESEGCSLEPQAGNNSLWQFFRLPLLFQVG